MCLGLTDRKKDIVWNFAWATIIWIMTENQIRKRKKQLHHQPTPENKKNKIPPGGSTKFPNCIRGLIERTNALQKLVT